MTPDDIIKLMQEMPNDITACVNWDEVNKTMAEMLPEFKPMGAGMYGVFGPNDAPHAAHSIPAVIYPEPPVIGTAFGHPIYAQPMDADADAELDEIMRAEREGR